jgi:hypothetical protein
VIIPRRSISAEATMTTRSYGCRRAANVGVLKRPIFERRTAYHAACAYAPVCSAIESRGAGIPLAPAQDRLEQTELSFAGGIPAETLGVAPGCVSVGAALEQLFHRRRHAFGIALPHQHTRFGA